MWLKATLLCTENMFLVLIDYLLYGSYKSGEKGVSIIYYATQNFTFLHKDNSLRGFASDET